MTEKNETNDVEKQQSKKEGDGKIQDDGELEKVKETKPPGLNASLVAFYTVSSSMFIIGWINLNSCPINIMIPIYLIVAGASAALAKFLSKIDNRYTFNAAIALVAFAFVWHMLGSYWVYREYQPNYDSSKGKYCNRTAYLLSFWMITFQYTVLIMFIILSGCYMLMRNEFKK